MNLRRLLRKKRDDGAGLAKYLYLSDKQLVYQLITSPENGKLRDSLEAYHKQIETLAAECNSALTAYLIFMGAAVLSKFDLVASVSAAGISLLPIAIKHVVLFGLSVSQLRYSLISVKRGYISGIFDRIYYSSTPSKRADLLARYPQAFDTLKYYPTQIGTLPHTASMRFPIRMVTMLAFLVVGLAIYIFFATWLFYSLACDVWLSTTPFEGFWSKATVAVSIALVVVSMLLPADLVLKRSYMHIGLVNMMNDAYKHNRQRYLKYSKWAQSIKARKS